MRPMNSTLWCWAAALLLGCEPAGSIAPPAVGAAGPEKQAPAGPRPAEDRDPAVPPAAWQALATLSPAQLPRPPADPTNRFADSEAAARLGQTWFFDPGFSGRLLDSDNNVISTSLGRQGQSGKVSCSGCHDPESGFADTHSQFGNKVSLGSGWGLRRAPSLLDVGQARLLMWDGRRDSFYNQVFEPFEAAVEMNSSRLYVAEQVFARYRSAYEKVFGPMVPAGDPGRFTDPRRFPPLTGATTGCQVSGNFTGTRCTGTEHGVPGDRNEYDRMTPGDQHAVNEVVVNVGKSIGAYLRKLSCGQGRFDAWMRGQRDALSPSEKSGAVLFVGKAGCVRCHMGPFFSDQSFHNIGIEPQVAEGSGMTDADDHGAKAGIAGALLDPLNTRGKYSDMPGGDGRLPAQVSPELDGAFRTPTLRCVSSRPSYMHTGQLPDLESVVDFFSRGGDPSGYPGRSELRPLALSAVEQADLVAFLKTLEGPGPERGLLGPPR